MRLNLRNQRAFALPMIILIIGVLTAAMAAGFAGVGAEFATNAAQRGQNRAYNLAETGLSQFLVLRGQSGWCQHCSDPATADSEWTRVTLTGGYADIVAVRVRPIVGAANAMYFIRSRGVDT